MERSSAQVNGHVVTTPLYYFDQEFQTRDELINHVRELSRDNGYSVVIRKSSAGRVWLGCDRGGLPRQSQHQNAPKRRSSSRLIGCPFELYGNKNGDYWSLSVNNNFHNHELSTSIFEHPMHCRLDAASLEHVRSLSSSGRFLATTANRLN
jgi:hypothetical protein